MPIKHIIKEEINQDLAWLKGEPNYTIKDIIDLVQDGKFNIDGIFLGVEISKFVDKVYLDKTIEDCGIPFEWGFNIVYTIKHYDYVNRNELDCYSLRDDDTDTVYQPDDYFKDEPKLPSLELLDKDGNNFWVIDDWMELKPVLNNNSAFGEIKEFMNESDLDWVKDSVLHFWDMNKKYVLDVSELESYPPMSLSPTSDRYTDIFISDIIDYGEEMGYHMIDLGWGEQQQVSIPSGVCYIYFNPNKFVEWDMCGIDDPTWDGEYELMDAESFIYYMENNFIKNEH